MKKALLDIEAILSCVTAALSMPNPNIEEVKKQVDQAQQKLIELAEGIEGSALN
jgi:hypothetical protein